MLSIIVNTDNSEAHSKAVDFCMTSMYRNSLSTSPNDKASGLGIINSMSALAGHKTQSARSKQVIGVLRL